MYIIRSGELHTRVELISPSPIPEKDEIPVITQVLVSRISDDKSSRDPFKSKQSGISKYWKAQSKKSSLDNNYKYYK
jgi:hypothetical protein